MTSNLFQPFRLHDLTLPNRIALAPMTRGRAGVARLPNQLMAEYYAQRAAKQAKPRDADLSCRGHRAATSLRMSNFPPGMAICGLWIELIAELRRVYSLNAGTKSRPFTPLGQSRGG